MTDFATGADDMPAYQDGEQPADNMPKPEDPGVQSDDGGDNSSSIWGGQYDNLLEKSTPVALNKASQSQGIDIAGILKKGFDNAANYGSGASDQSAPPAPGAATAAPAPAPGAAPATPAPAPTPGAPPAPAPAAFNPQMAQDQLATMGGASSVAKRQDRLGAGNGGAPDVSLKDVLNEIDRAYPANTREWAMARAQTMQEWNKNQVAIRRETLRNEAMAGRVQAQGNFAQQRVNTQVAGRQGTAAFVEGNKNNRAMQGIAARIKIAQQNNDTRAAIANTNVLRSMVSTQLGNMGDTADIQEKTDALMNHFGVQRPGAQQGGAQPQSQPSPRGGPQVQAAPTNATQRVAGTSYSTPKGVLQWTGTGWIKPSQQ